MKSKTLIGAISLILVFIACENDLGNQDINQVNEVQIIGGLSALPLSVIDPTQNSSNIAKVELGRALFWDPILSGTKDIACATCHHPNEGYADNLARSLGTGGMGLGSDRTGTDLINRNSPTIINTAFNGIDRNGSYDPAIAEMFWDNRTLSLESQAIQPILSAQEMRGTLIAQEDIINTVLARLQNIPQYEVLFQNAFAENDAINETNLAKAIAAFERSIIANQSPFDEYMRGDENAMTNQQVDGMNNFIQVGCADCHSGPMLSDYQLHNIGVPRDRINDDGDGNAQFRTPSLRNLASTGPYMHNGTFNSLNQVLQHYDNNRRNNNNLDPEFRDLENLNNRSINNIISFIGALNDDSFDKTIPLSVPSGMNPGGNVN